MDIKGPITDTIRQYMESATITQAMILIAGMIIVLLFIVWVFNRMFNAQQKQLDNQQRQIAQQQRQLDISEKNAETAALNAETFRRATNSLEELTDQMHFSTTAIATATSGIGEIGRAQAGTNDLITTTSHETVKEIIAELTRVEKSFELFFDASKNPTSALFQAMRQSLKPEFDALNRGLSDLKGLLSPAPNPTPTPTPTPEPPPVVPLPPPPPPTFPPGPPPMPIRAESMFVYEDWVAAQLYDERDSDPARRWIKANSPDEAHANERIIPHAGGRALELRLAPDFYGQQVGARVFYTNQGRWDTLAGLDTLYVRYAVQTPDALNIDEGDGTSGKWATLGFQLKDGSSPNALVQMNARTINGTTFARLAFADGAVIQSDAVAYPVGKWVVVDLTIALRKERTAKVWALFDGIMKLTGIARTLDAVSGQAGWGLALYSNALYAPARLLVGWLVASRLPIVDAVGEFLPERESEL